METELKEETRVAIKIMLANKIPFSFEIIDMMEKEIEKAFESKEQS